MALPIRQVSCVREDTDNPDALRNEHDHFVPLEVEILSIGPIKRYQLPDGRALYLELSVQPSRQSLLWLSKKGEDCRIMLLAISLFNLVFTTHDHERMSLVSVSPRQPGETEVDVCPGAGIHVPWEADVELHSTAAVAPTALGKGGVARDVAPVAAIANEPVDSGH